MTQVNAIRCSRGLRPLCWHRALYDAARGHSEEQNLHGYMGHDSPDPSRRTLLQRMQIAGYDGVMYGEVVAWGYRDAVSVVEGWMNSRDHRAILIDPKLTEAAFSRVCEYWTGNFGAPRVPCRAPASYRCPPPARPSCVPAPPPAVTHQLCPPAIRTPVTRGMPPAPVSRCVPGVPAPVPAPRASRRPTRGG